MLSLKSTEPKTKLEDNDFVSLTLLPGLNDDRGNYISQSSKCPIYEKETSSSDSYTSTYLMRFKLSKEGSVLRALEDNLDRLMFLRGEIILHQEKYIDIISIISQENSAKTSEDFPPIDSEFDRYFNGSITARELLSGYRSHCQYAEDNQT